MLTIKTRVDRDTRLPARYYERQAVENKLYRDSLRDERRLKAFQEMGKALFVNNPNDGKPQSSECETITTE